MASLFGPIFLTALAQAATPEDVLRGALRDPRVDRFDRAVQISAEAKSANPVEKAELKVSRGELLQSDMKYGLRVYPKGYTATKAGQKFQESLEAGGKISRKEGLSVLLAGRYLLLARIANLKEKKKIADALSLLTKNANKALSYAATRDRAELKSYLKAKADLDRLQIKIADIERDFVNLQMEMRSLKLADVEQFEFKDWAEMSDLRDRLKSSSAKMVAAETLTGQVAKAEVSSAHAEIEYARARDGKWLDHVEVSMKEDQREKVYGVEVSFLLPFASAPDLSRIEKEVRAARDDAKAADTADTAALEFKNGLVEMQTLLDLHRSLTEGEGKPDLEKMRKAAQKISSQDPLLAVEMQRSWYESRDQILELELRIRTLYISYLHESSQIADAPDVNQLSKSLKRIL